MDERFPLPWPDTLEEQTLRGATAWVAATDEPGGKHLGVVGHDEVARRKQCRQIANRSFLPGAGAAADDQQPRLPAWTRLLRDQAIWQIEVEVRNGRGHRRQS